MDMDHQWRRDYLWCWTTCEHLVGEHAKGPPVHGEGVAGAHHHLGGLGGAVVVVVSVVLLPPGTQGCRTG